MFELCSRFFIFQATWNNIKFYFLFCFFLPLNSFFLGLEAVLELLLTHTLSCIVLVLFISQNSERLWWVADFQWKNMQKHLEFFCKWKIHENYPIVTPFMGLSRLGTWLVVILLCGMCPHAIRVLETIRHVMLMPDWDSAILCHPMPFCGVEDSFLIGWSAVTCCFCVAIFTRLQLRMLFCNQICELAVRWLTPMLFGDDPWLTWDAKYANLSSLKLTSGTPTLSPKPILPMHWSDKTPTDLTLQTNRESAFLN